MPIEVAHSPNLGLVGAGAFYAGAGNPDDAAKRAQLSLQRDQMNTEAQLKNAQLAQQADQFAMGQQYDLYKQLASMANNNAQLQYRTQADNDQLQYRTQAEDAARYNAQMNDNAQLEYRTQAAQADRQAGMANENMQMTYQQQSRKEMMDLQQQYEMARLNHTEELHMGRLQKGLANLDVMLGSGEIDEEGHANLTAQLTNGLTPFQKRAAEAQQLQMDLKSKQIQQELETQAAFAKRQATAWSENPPGTVEFDWNTGGTTSMVADPKGNLHKIMEGGSVSGRVAGEGGGGTPKTTEPKYKQPTVEEYHGQVMDQVNQQIINSGQDPSVFYTSRYDPASQKEKPIAEWGWTPEGRKIYNAARSTVDKGEQAKIAEIRNLEKTQRDAEAERVSGRGTYVGLPWTEKMRIKGAAIKEASENWIKDNPGEELKTNSSEFIHQYLQPVVANFTDNWWKAQANKNQPAGGVSGNDLAPAVTPTGTPQGRTGPVAPDPITPEREIGVKGAKPLDPIQSKMLATLGKATIQAWSINAPLEVKQTYAKDVSEGIALFKKYGSLDAMPPQDLARFKQIDNQITDLGKRMEAKQQSEGGYQDATAGNYMTYLSRNPNEAIMRAAMSGPTLGASLYLPGKMEQRMQAGGIIKKKPVPPLPATAQEAEAAARESDRLYQILKAQKKVK